VSAQSLKMNVTNVINCGIGSVLSNPNAMKPRSQTKTSTRPNISTRIVRRTLMCVR
jgi:hypothetical protein